MNLTKEDCFRYLTENYSEYNQADASTALSQFHDEDVIDLLRNVLINNKNVNVRENAAKSLGVIGDPSAVNYLKKALNDRVNVTMAAWNALKKIRGSEAKQIIEQGLPTLNFSMVLLRWSMRSFWESLFAKEPSNEYEYCENVAKEHYKSFPLNINIWRLVGVKRQLSAGEAVSLYYNLIKQGTVPNFGNPRTNTDYIIMKGKDAYGFGYVAIIFP